MTQELRIVHIQLPQARIGVCLRVGHAVCPPQLPDHVIVLRDEALHADSVGRQTGAGGQGLRHAVQRLQPVLQISSLHGAQRAFGLLYGRLAVFLDGFCAPFAHFRGKAGIQVFVGHGSDSLQSRYGVVHGVQQRTQAFLAFQQGAAMGPEGLKCVEIRGLQQRGNVLQGHAQRTIEQDLLQPQQLRLAIKAIAGVAARSRTQQPCLVVMVQGAHTDAGHAGQLSDCTGHDGVPPFSTRRGV